MASTRSIAFHQTQCNNVYHLCGLGKEISAYSKSSAASVFNKQRQIYSPGKLQKIINLLSFLSSLRIWQLCKLKGSHISLITELKVTSALIQQVKGGITSPRNFKPTTMSLLCLFCGLW